MLRTIFEFGPFAINSYGVMLALAFFAAIWYVHRRAQAENLAFDQMLNVAYILIFGGVIGGRLSYVLMHLSDFADDPLSSINPFQGDQFGISGLNLYGGVILAVLGMLIYVRIKKLPLLAVGDLFAPALGLGIGIGRIGCFLNGCCFGTPTDLPWSILYPANSMPYYVYGNQAIHPAQLYTAAYGWLLFFALLWLLKRKKFDGQVMALYFMFEAVFRYLIEYVRYYETEMRFDLLGMEPTYNQIISILFLLTGLIIYWRCPRRMHRDPVAEIE
ncbi:MAG: prolipoprotein diacylglyceryl transferase [FCB group bacterium]|nr:prolipoprotein diacylglyceryl transferase [FCB group bacterium]